MQNLGFDLVLGAETADEGERNIVDALKRCPLWVDGVDKIGISPLREAA